MAGLTTGRNDGRLPAWCLGSGTHILSTQQRRVRVRSLPLDMGKLQALPAWWGQKPGPSPMVVPAQQPLIQQDRGFLLMLRAAHAAPGIYPQGPERVAFGSTISRHPGYLGRKRFLS